MLYVFKTESSSNVTTLSSHFPSSQSATSHIYISVALSCSVLNIHVNVYKIKDAGPKLNMILFGAVKWTSITYSIHPCQ